MKKNCILLTHTHIYDNELYKHDIMSFVVDYFRENNTDSYIILTGHGVRPSEDILSKYDYVHWEDEVDISEIGKGHPKDVSVGINHALDKNYDYIFKCRADSIVLIPNINEYCFDIIRKENKKILTSFGTSATKCWLGDLVMFSEINFLRKIWNEQKWDYSVDGLINFGNGLIREVSDVTIDSTNWLGFIRDTISYRSPDSLKWVDLLGPHPHNNEKWNKLINQYSVTDILNNDFDFNSYIWGNDWIEDNSRNYLNEEIFYVK